MAVVPTVMIKREIFSNLMSGKGSLVRMGHINIWHIDLSLHGKNFGRNIFF